MWERLENALRRFLELEQMLSDPDILADPAQLTRLAKEQSDLSDLVLPYREYLELQRNLKEGAVLASDPDPEVRELWQTEARALTMQAEALEKSLKRLLAPSDARDRKDVLIEIRAGTGGEEAALFASDLLRMYSRYAERQSWRTEVLEASPTDIGGFREVVLSVVGKGAYSRLKYESGVHRVQRVPSTESQGRIHTSTATVAVMPEAEEVDVEIRPEDLRIDTFRSGGAGGQHVNKTESAVRITHLPTGLAVICQDEKSQYKNRDKAMRVLRSRLLDLREGEAHAALAEQRRQQVGTGDRSERIRTYNFPQGRMTDHRVGFTSHRLAAILDGDLDEVIEVLSLADESARLGEVSV